MSAEPPKLPPAPQVTLSPWQRLAQLSRLERRDLWVVFVYAAGLGALSLATPIAAQTLLNTVAFGNVFQPILVLALLVAVGLIFAATLNAAQVLVVEHLSRRIFVRVATRMQNRLTYAADVDSDEAARLSNRFFDVVSLEKSLAVLLFDGVAGALQIFVGLALLAFYHPLLLAFGLAIIAVLLFIVFALGHNAVGTAVKESKAKYGIADGLTALSHHRFFLVGRHLDAVFGERIKTLADNWLSARRRHFRVVLRQTIALLLLQVVVTAALFGLGGWLVLEERLAIGQLVAAELIVTATVAQLAKFGKYFSKTYDLLAALDKIGQVADLEVEQPTGEKISGDGPLEIFAEDLVVVARGAPLNFKVAAKEKVAVVGPEASGKTSLVQILSGAADAVSGVFLVGNAPIRELSLESLREHVHSLTAVDVTPNFGTVDDSVCFGRERTVEEVRNALAAVDVLDVVNRLPQGRLTPMDLARDHLSSGQRARLALARMLLARPRLLLIDGFLDALHPELKAEAIKILLGPDAPWTALVVTADPAVLSACDGEIALSRRPLSGGDDRSAT